MSFQKTPIAVAALAAAVLMAGLSAGALAAEVQADDEAMERSALANAKFTMQQAVDIAEKEVGGKSTK